ncbi:MAG: flavodoxin domain-containing protein [Desulfobacterales bacterium]
MGRVLVIYATRTGETRDIAELIAEGVRLEGHEARVADARSIQNEGDLRGYDGYAFGSATYHGDMLPAMKTLLFLAEKADLEGRVGGAFGAFGWSGEANDRIFQTMKNVFRMDMLGDCLRLKSSRLGGGLQMAHEYGRQLARKLKS